MFFETLGKTQPEASRIVAKTAYGRPSDPWLPGVSWSWGGRGEGVGAAKEESNTSVTRRQDNSSPLRHLCSTFAAHSHMAVGLLGLSGQNSVVRMAVRGYHLAYSHSRSDALQHGVIVTKNNHECCEHFSTKPLGRKAYFKSGKHVSQLKVEPHGVIDARQHQLKGGNQKVCIYIQLRAWVTCLSISWSLAKVKWSRYGGQGSERICLS